MTIFITIIHWLVSLALIVVILLQVGKGAEVGSAFGGSSQTVFGASGPGTFLEKMTGVMAGIFMLTSISLAYLHSGHHISSVVQEHAAPSSPAPPAAPAPAQGTK